MIKSVIDNKECFKSIARNHIKIQGIESLLTHLETNTDFFNAPASTKYHLNEDGGLCQHSINVYTRLTEEINSEIMRRGFSGFRDDFDETVAICALFHDLCKANFYKVDHRNQKNDIGVWERVPYYTIEDQFPYGHGEKSVYLLSKFIELTDEEAMAIRWHMGAYDESIKGGGMYLNNVYEKYPLALHLHIADLKATHIDERKQPL